MSLEKLTNLKTLIRADSSVTIGHGHIRRDLVLANKFKDISFACLELEGSLISEINFRVFTLKTNDLDELISLINTHKFELLIIDHYGISYDDERKIKERTGVKILSFDDEYKEHFSDILLNVNIFAKAKKYENLLPSACEIWCGQEFMLVRDEFYQEKKIKREKIYDIFIALGGTDIQNLSANLALKLLEKNLKIALVTTSANANLKPLKELEKAHKNLSLFVDSNQIAKLMNESKELIISASSLVNETLILGANFTAVQVAKNQEQIYMWLLENGYKAVKSEEICQIL
ncbi:UDP-2,4-diacetamido-2,4,6-trideoxy-beta-L-altropyranose hydrolase [Campylobacter sp. RM16187]|uniref:UDP-2,4-diacetamido-2,4, 6-trideoxy-beta-L-altropyranose hydrolase n=1 Tax=Campylobacter sp. RM16187 TaxID=1660063 RepID=UPI0021B6D84F|nr:UDP-2,4-diacetamido-2,4,6-trideoxy-beta-L-altropyranose hydrolase [Campylobacter sp. RM16187]QKG30146.1 UDP-2,4-diacetamido-2,4,6-trideoxy-beta-L-altropyranosyl transferase [Campylobacter sp. RM16187]